MLNALKRLLEKPYTEFKVSNLELTLLGSPEILWQGQVVSLPPPKTFAMLCYLALQPEGASRRELAELFWGPDKTGSVRVALTELRKLPDADEWLRADDQLIKVTVSTDVAQFEKALENEDFARALEICKEAKTFLKGFELRNADAFVNWLEIERSRLSELYLTALQGRIAELEKHQHFSDAIKLARILLEQDKLNEDVHRAVIRLEHKRGNDEAALAQFETLREILKEELGEEPLEETLELLREIEGDSISGAKAALVLKDASAIPNLASKLFGREKLLLEIQNHIKNKDHLLLQGLGGSGKTALAAAVASQHLQHKQSKVLWLQAGDDDPDALFDAMARAFDARQLLSQTKDKTKAIQDLLVKHKITLLVLDDVWNAYGLSKVLETLPKIAFIATSRQRYPKLKRLDVGKLPREAAVQLIEHHASFSPSPLLPFSLSIPGEQGSFEVENPQPLMGEDSQDFQHRKRAGELCSLLGDHAFAVRIAGITLAVDGISPEILLERIKDAPHVLKIPAEFAEAGRESVTSLLSVSLNALSDEAHEALLAFGVLFSSSATAELLSLCTRRDEEITEHALAELQKRGLADRITEAGSDIISYRLHDLVFSFAKANNNLRKLTAVKASKSLLDKHQHDFETLDAEINNILGAAETAKKTDTRLCVDMMQQLVVGNAYYHARGHSPRSFELLKVAVEKAKELEDLEAAHYLIARMGDTYRELYGDLDRALEAFEEALEIARRRKDHHREAIMLSLIGVVRFEKKTKGVDEYLEQAYQLSKANKDDFGLNLVLQNMSYVAGMREDYKKARELALDSIEVSQRLLSHASLEKSEIDYTLFFSRLNLSVAEHRLDRLEESLVACKEALNLATARNNELWIGYVLQEMGEVYHKMKNHTLAQDALSQALNLYRQNSAKSDEENLAAFITSQGYSLPEEVNLTLS